MATTPVQFFAPTGLTLKLELYPFGSDTIANTAGGDSATEAMNRKQLYSVNITQAISGWHTAIIKSGTTPVAIYVVYLEDDTSIYRCHDLQERFRPIGTGVGQIDVLSGQVKSDLRKILGTGLTESSVGYLAAAFIKLFDVASPVLTSSSINQTGDSFARIGAPVNASIAADIAGNLTAIQNVQNNTFIATSIPATLERPDAESVTVSIAMVFSDETGTSKNLDSDNPTITLVNDVGDDLSSRLGVFTNPATGKYTVPYTSSSTDDLEGLHWDITGTINGKLRRMVAYTQIVDTTAVDFTAADRVKLNTLHDIRIPGIIQPQTGDSYAIINNETHGNASLKTVLDIILDHTGTSGVIVDDASKVGYSLSSAGLDSILAESGISASVNLVNDAGSQLTSINARQALALILSSLAGLVSGVDSNAPVFKPAAKGDASSRITAVVDATGRTAITLRVPD